MAASHQCSRRCPLARLFVAFKLCDWSWLPVDAAGFLDVLREEVWRKPIRLAQSHRGTLSRFLFTSPGYCLWYPNNGLILSSLAAVVFAGAIDPFGSFLVYLGYMSGHWSCPERWPTQPQHLQLFAPSNMIRKGVKTPPSQKWNWGRGPGILVLVHFFLGEPPHSLFR